MANKPPMPEKLEFYTAAVGDHDKTGGQRKVLKNNEYGVTLSVTWFPPAFDIGIQAFSCKALPHWSWNNYEAMRKTYNEKVATQ